MAGLLFIWLFGLLNLSLIRVGILFIIVFGHSPLSMDSLLVSALSIFLKILSTNLSLGIGWSITFLMQIGCLEENLTS